MRLKDYDHAEVKEGYRYELRKGVIVVSDFPDPIHAMQVCEVQHQLMIYRIGEPDEIKIVGDAANSKIMIWDLETERHPDLSVYLTPPPRPEDPWDEWIPEIVIEVLSSDTAKCDYEEKPDEYLAFGVREYWIADAEKQEMTVLRRRGKRWTSPRVVRPPEVYETPLLPGLEFDCKAVFEAARAAGQ